MGARGQRAAEQDLVPMTGWARRVCHTARRIEQEIGQKMRLILRAPRRARAQKGSCRRTLVAAA